MGHGIIPHMTTTSEGLEPPEPPLPPPPPELLLDVASPLLELVPPPIPEPLEAAELELDDAPPSPLDDEPLLLLLL